jgi:ABC-type branched-subunit amino acid transport system substrate-binding protein
VKYSSPTVRAAASPDVQATRRFRRNAIARMCLLVGVGALLAACSSGTSSSSSTSGPSTTTSKQPIKVMALGTISSTSLSNPQQVSGVNAVADAVNASGGINGRKIVVLTCNDNLDPDQTEACARTAVSDHVAAVVEVITPFVPQMLPILQKAGIPLLADSPDNPQELVNPISFPIGGGSYTMMSALGTALVNDAHCKKVSIVVLNLASTEISGRNIAAAVDLAGGTVTNTVDVPPSLVAFSPVVAAAQAKGAQCIANVLSPSQIVGLFSSIQGSSNPNMTVGSPGTSYTPMLLSEIKGMTAKSLVTQDFYEAGSDKVGAFAAQMKQYEPGVPLDNYDIQTWEGMTMFADVARTLPNVTGPAMVAALDKTTGLNVAGIPVRVGYASSNTDKLMSRVTDTQVVVYTVTPQGGYSALAPVNTQAALEKFLATAG